jgi:hypothetical protein
MSEKNDRIRVKLTGLWEQSYETTEGTRSYLRGHLNPSLTLVVWPNGFKKKGSDPDWIAYLVPARSGAKSEAEGKASDSDVPQAQD